MSRILVLRYHAVSERWDFHLAVTPGALEAQLSRLVRRGYRGATFHDALTKAASGKTLVVTFDGGFRSTHELARPVLTGLGLPGTVFVPTGFIDEGGLAEWPGLDVWVGGPDEDELSLMSWDQLRGLCDLGWEVGAHSRSHPRLTHLDDAELGEELKACKADCQAALGRGCRSLSYPYGDVNRRVVEAATAAGFETAAGLPVNYGAPHTMNWPRIAIERKDTMIGFELKLAAARLSRRIAGRRTDEPAGVERLERARSAGGASGRRPRSEQASSPRVAVVVPCYNDGRYLSEALDSIREDEPVEVVVVDDASTDHGTTALLGRLEAGGVPVIRHDVNRGLSESRMSGVRATRAPYVFPLDADDLLIPGALGALADFLDAHPELAAGYGDHAQFGTDDWVIRAPERLDPYRLAYRNEYPVASLFRRSTLEEVGGWRDIDGEVGYEDWHLWMTLAERGHQAAHAAPATVTMRRRIHGRRMLTSAGKRHRTLYAKLRRLHPALFARMREHRRASSLGRVRTMLYPVAFGARPPTGIWSRLRRIAARTGLMTLAESWRSRRLRRTSSS
jgi:peptidoglycan/xylan/chitin deacetylase (PgdA/CDA1 family)